jgi:hypothetical protein
VKIASQRLRYFPPPNLCAFCALYGKFLRLFRIINLQTPFPAYPPDSWRANPFFSHPSRTPGVYTPPWSLRSELSAICPAFSCNSLVISRLQPLVTLFALFSALPPFVFNSLQPLFPKYPGWGTRGTAISACPLQAGLSSDDHLDLPVEPRSDR